MRRRSQTSRNGSPPAERGWDCHTLLAYCRGSAIDAPERVANMPTYNQRERLHAAVRKAELSYEFAKRVAAREGRAAPVRHKCFISYHGADIDGVTDFVEAFNDAFIPRVVGVSDSDQFKDPVNSEDEVYIKSQIGAKYLSDSTVTMLYVGPCAFARKYVDWELSSSLRNDAVNKRNGLMAITPADLSKKQVTCSVHGQLGAKLLQVRALLLLSPVQLISADND